MYNIFNLFNIFKILNFCSFTIIFNYIVNFAYAYSISETEKPEEETSNSYLWGLLWKLRKENERKTFPNLSSFFLVF